MKTALESTLVFISAGTACSQDQDGAVQTGQDKFGLGKSPGNGPVHSFWVGGLFQICMVSYVMNLLYAWTYTDREHSRTQNIQKLQCVPLIESFYQLIWKYFPCGNHQLANHKNSPQTGSPTGKRFEQSTARRHDTV